MAFGRVGPVKSGFCTSGGDRNALSDQLLESFARELVRGIGLPADVTNDAMTATDARTYLVHGDAKRLARGEAAAYDGSAVRAHHDAMQRPPRGGQIQGSSAHVRLQLRRSALVREAEGLRVHRSAPNKNGQATSGPAVLVERRVDVDN